MKSLIRGIVFFFIIICIATLGACAKKDTSKDDASKLLPLLLKSAVNDLNHDGYSDLAIGAPHYDTDRTSDTEGGGTGRVYLFFGNSKGIKLWNQDKGEPPSRQQQVLTGEMEGSYFGTSIAYGDVDNDRKCDLLVSAPGYNDTGRIYIYHGGKSLTSDPPATLDGTFDGFGQRIALGDLNGDTYLDLIVASYNYEDYTNTGRVLVYNGSEAGFSTTPSVTLDGEQADCLFGYTLRTGDVNGDGFADLVVAAPYYDAAADPDDNTGRVYVYYGSAEGIPAAPSLALTGEQSGNYFGRFITIGDINSDDLSDLIIGTPPYDTDIATWDGNYTGRMYVYHGNAAGIAAAPSFTIDGPDAWYDYGENVLLADVNGDDYLELYSTGRIFSGIANDASTMTYFDAGIENDNYGITADINGDGYADLILSQYGQVIVYYGSESYDALTYANPIDCITGEDGADGFGVIE